MAYVFTIRTACQYSLRGRGHWIVAVAGDQWLRDIQAMTEGLLQ
jgi:hypothetical protein